MFGFNGAGGGGGGYRILQQSMGGAKLQCFTIFPESLGPKGSDWCFQVDAPPPPPPQVILKPRRVRWTLILGSTLVRC